MNKDLKLEQTTCSDYKLATCKKIISSSLKNLFSYPWINKSFINCGLNVTGLFLDL